MESVSYNSKDIYTFALNGNLHDLTIALNQQDFSHGDINWYKDDCGRSAIHVAVLNNNHHLIEILLDAGLDINDKDYNNDTALHLASRFGAVESVMKLLKYDNIYIDDIDTCDNIDKYETYEDKISEFNCKQLILDANADRHHTFMNIKNEEKRSLLMARRKGIDNIQQEHIKARRDSLGEV